MKKKIAIITLCMCFSCFVGACNTPIESDNIIGNGDDSDTSEDSDEDTEESLPFGFTPDEFVENFSNFGSYSNIYVDDFSKASGSEYIFTIKEPDGKDIEVSLLTNKDDKVTNINIDIPDITCSNFRDITRTAISATDMHLDVDLLDKLLKLSEPQTIKDYENETFNGISISLHIYDNSGSLSIVRDHYTAGNYDYIEIHSNPKKNTATQPEPSETPIITETPAITEAPETQAPAPSDSETLSNGYTYQTILDTYTQTMAEMTPILVDQYNNESSSLSGDINALAELSTEKTSELAEICTDGVSEMAELMLTNGDDYSTYEEWAGKLQDVYMEYAGQIQDAYMASVN